MRVRDRRARGRLGAAVQIHQDGLTGHRVTRPLDRQGGDDLRRLPHDNSRGSCNHERRRGGIIRRSTIRRHTLRDQGHRAHHHHAREPGYSTSAHATNPLTAPIRLGVGREYPPQRSAKQIACQARTHIPSRDVHRPSSRFWHQWQQRDPRASGHLMTGSLVSRDKHGQIGSSTVSIVNPWSQPGAPVKTGWPRLWPPRPVVRRLRVG